MSAPIEPRRGQAASATLRHGAACMALVALTVGAFSNTLWNDFVSYDDWFLIEENERV